MWYCKWAGIDIGGLEKISGIASLYTEIGEDGRVRREIGFNDAGEVVHKCPSDVYRYGTYGLFDLSNVERAEKADSPSDVITEAEFEQLWRKKGRHE
jgi:hypothetical protein